MLRDLFAKYRCLKEKLDFYHKGIAIKYVIAFDLIGIVYNKKPAIKPILFFFSKISLKPLKKVDSNSILFTIGKYGKRKDYYEILNFVRNQNRGSIYHDLHESKNVPCFHPGNIYKGLKAILPLKKDLGFKSFLLLAAKTTYYLNSIDELHERNPSCSKYCAFSSVHPLEAMFTLYFKQKNIPTFSLQHGLYFVFKEKILLDALAYENFVSDYHFCWGEFTKDEFIKYGIDKNALLIGGYPREVKRKTRPSSLNRNKCVIFLARQAFHDTNLKLIPMLNSIEFADIDFYFKLHPSLEWQQYNEILSDSARFHIVPQSLTITELLQDSSYGWAIAINTAAYYEAYLNNLPCLRFNDGSFEDSADVLPDRFANQVTLIKNYKRIPFDNQEKLQLLFKSIDDELHYTIGLNVKNYIFQ